MVVLKVSAVSLSLLGVMLIGTALLMSKEPEKSGLVSLGAFICAGLCLLGGAILTAVQPFVPDKRAQ